MQTHIDTRIDTVLTPGVAESGHTVLEFCPKEVIFFQGDREDHVLQLVSGEVVLTMATLTGKEAIVGTLAAGAFLGEEILAGRKCRVVTATAVTPCTVRVFTRQQVWQSLQHESTFREHFVTSMLSRTIRLEHDLVDQMLNSAKKRLARALLLLASKVDPTEDTCVLPSVSQEKLASMVGTTRGRINRFMNEFRKRGIVNYDQNGITVTRSLLRHVPESDNSLAQ
ncbi:MAG: Crp/Fnr family transcriptional regulator [Acidobacteria bacterium]|jgi:CRP/FNR family cyclic AMP-dependent transcriptional regulator|nr:Crp/Fnr family transcriptional regulator [Acidobacteriota bacterium]